MALGLVDQYGNPIDLKDLKEDQASPLMGVRESIFEPVASTITPDKLMRITREAVEDGNPVDWLTFCEEMESDSHYGSVLSTRKLAVSGVRPSVESASDNEHDVKLADAIRLLIRRPEFSRLIKSMVDALGKGYSVCEIIWDTKGKTWEPKRFKWIDPRWFGFARDTDEIYLREMASSSTNPGQPLTPYKYIVHYPKLRKGKHAVAGLARMAAVNYMCKLYAVKDWMRFMEVFGMPMRVGKYGPAATQNEKNVLKRAVHYLGVDAAAIIPESMKIEFQQVATTGGKNQFESLCNWLDQQTSKAVLGQTMTTDSGSSRSQAEVHNEVRKDILAADLSAIDDTLNEQLVKAYIDLNFGPQENYPKIEHPLQESIDIAALTAMVDRGMEVEQSPVRDRLGLPDPTEGAKLLRPIGNEEQTKVEQPKSELNAANPQPIEESDIDPAADWEELLEPAVESIQGLLSSCSNFEEFNTKLPELLETMDSSDLIKSLAIEMFKSRGLGDAQDN